MSKIIRYAPHAERKALRVGAAHAALVNDISEALLRLGGQAHRNLVIDQVGRMRGADKVSLGGLRDQVIRAFEAQMASDRDGRALFALPFGPGSHRWALDYEALHYLREQMVG